MTAVEWLAEKYNYVTWMRNRDEISAAEGDEWRRIYLEQAKAMEEEQLKGMYNEGAFAQMRYFDGKEFISAEQYYKETYGE